MPSYPGLLENDIPWDDVQSRVDAMAMLGVPYGKDALHDAHAVGADQAHAIAAQIVAEGGPAELDNREIVALIAYLQRLGTDIQAKPALAGEARADSGLAGHRTRRAARAAGGAQARKELP
jgi:cytochrome c oxidase cbb3-type subunit I/II